MSDKRENLNQVQLFKLLFTLNWEDPKLDQQALRIQSGDRVFGITSGCCNILEFLLYDPSVIFAVDINPTQSYLMELKIQAFRNFDHNEFIQFIGIENARNRVELYKDRIAEHLTEDAQQYWQGNLNAIAKGIYFQGRFERFVNIAGKAIRILQGNKRVKKLFKIKDSQEQKAFFDDTWNTRRMKLIFNLMFNKRTLAKKGLNADYFHFDDDSTSFAESFFNRYKKAVRNIPVYNNYFLSLYLQGKYNSTDEMPDCYKKENFETIKARVDRIKIYTKDAQQWFNQMEDESIDCFALSNIAELMSLEETEILFREVLRTASQEARIIFRNLMIPREIPESLTDQIILNKDLSKELLATDRSFVYSKVNAYQIRKN